MIRRKRQSPDAEIIGTEIVKRAVRIAKDFEIERCVAHHFTICLNARARLCGLDQNCVSHGAVRAGFSAGRKGCAAREKRCGQHGYS